MRNLIIFVGLAFAALFAYIKLNQFLGEDANVAFQLLGYTVTLSMMQFLVAAVLTFAVFFILFRILGGLFRTKKRVSNWNKNRNEKNAQQKLGIGFLALMKGDWKRAEKQLVSKTKHIEVPFVNFLAAAQAAQEQGNYRQRDEYLRQAAEKAPKDRLAINMTKARLDQQIGKADYALKTLLEVENEGRGNAQYVAMLAQAYDELDENEKLSHLLPEAKRLGALPNEVIEEMQVELDLDEFKTAEDKDLAWKRATKKSRKDPELVAAYAEYQVEKGRVDLAEKMIVSTLKSSWDDNLVNTYGRLKSTNRKKILRQLDGWLLARPENAELHLAAGRQSAESKDVERAQKEFQEAIRLGGLPEAFEELGLLHEGEQDLRKALALYRSGLATANGVAPQVALEQLKQVETAIVEESSAAADGDKTEEKPALEADEAIVKEGELLSKSDA